MFDDLQEILSSIGVAKLSDYLGHDRCDLLEGLGIPIVANELARAIITSDGINCLKNKELRYAILRAQKSEEEAIAINQFNWGNNSNTRSFLNLIGINAEEVDLTKPAPSATIEVGAVKKPLHNYQNWIRKKLLIFLRETTEPRLIVHMPTGSGKTRTSMEAVIDLMRYEYENNYNVVWMAHSDELCEQAVGSFKNLWKTLGCGEAEIVRLWGGRRPAEISSTKCSFIVTSFQTAYRMVSTPDNNIFSLGINIRRKNKVLIVDEAHQSTAPTYRMAIDFFTNNETKIIGLTATPGRHHTGQETEATQELSRFYQNNKLTITGDNGEPLRNPIAFLRDRGILSDVDHKIWTIDGPSIKLSDDELNVVQNQLDLPSSVLKKLGNNIQRTLQIVANINEIAINQNMQTIVFAPTKENAVDIALILMTKGCEARAITTDTDPNERRQFIKNFQNGDINVLTNFGVLTTGFDSPNIDAVVIARPTTSVVLWSQMIGRGIRGPAMGGTTSCLVVDVMDNIINMPEIDKSFEFFDQFFREV